jgi:hypothetical protein
MRHYKKPLETSARDPGAEQWISVGQLSRMTGEPRRGIYHQLDLGMPHSRIGRRIRIRLCDWDAWHRHHLVGGEGVRLGH